MYGSENRNRKTGGNKQKGKRYTNGGKTKHTYLEIPMKKQGSLRRHIEKLTKNVKNSV